MLIAIIQGLLVLAALVTVVPVFLLTLLFCLRDLLWALLDRILERFREPSSLTVPLHPSASTTTFLAESKNTSFPIHIVHGPERLRPTSTQPQDGNQLSVGDSSAEVAGDGSLGIDKGAEEGKVTPGADETSQQEVEGTVAVTIPGEDGDEGAGKGDAINSTRKVRAASPLASVAGDWHLLGLPSRISLSFVHALAGIYMHAYNRTTVYEQQKLVKLVLNRPPGTPLITISNHMSTLDDPFLWCQFCLRTSDPRFARWTLTAKDICFTNGLTGYFCRAARCIPIDRRGGLMQPGLTEAIDRLNQGGWLHIFPEGRITQLHVPLQRLKWGLASIIDRVKAKYPPIVVCVAHSGFETLMPEKKGALGWHSVAPCWFRRISIVVSDPVVYDLPTLRQCATLAVQQSDTSFGVEAPQEGEVKSDPAQLMSSVDLASLEQGAGKEKSGQERSGAVLGSVEEDTDGENEPSLPLSLPPGDVGEREKGEGKAAGAAVEEVDASGGGIAGGEGVGGEISVTGVAAEDKEGGDSNQLESKQVTEGGREPDGGADESSGGDNSAQTGGDPGVIKTEGRQEGGGNHQGDKKTEPTVTDEVSRRLYAFITADVKGRLQEAVWEAHRRQKEGRGKRDEAEPVGEEAC